MVRFKQEARMVLEKENARLYNLHKYNLHKYNLHKWKQLGRAQYTEARARAQKKLLICHS